MAVTDAKRKPLQPLRHAPVPEPAAGCSPEAVGKALALRRLLDVVEPHAIEARAAVKAAEGHESHACAVAVAETLEASVARLKSALRAGGLFA